MQTPLVIVGATATGKSSLAMAVAASREGEIVNADALQVYRGFDIGTAKPTAADRKRVPHHLLDILDPAEPFSAGEFARRARAAIEAIQKRERLPIIVGGSGLYVRALLEGISELPPPDPALREELRDRCRQEGLEGLRNRLAELDPATAARIESGDSQRTLRALEVVLSTGRPLSKWVADQPFGAQRMDAEKVGLTLARTLLYDRIEERIGRMLEAGWVDEVARLLASGLTPDAPAFQAIGYRQLARHLTGDLSLEEAVAEVVLATRRYAKRQETWFRRESGIHWLDVDEVGDPVTEVLAWLDTRGDRHREN